MAEETLNTPTEDSTENVEHPEVGPQESEDATQTQDSEETEHPEGSEKETEVDWKKRHHDQQAELTRLQQRVAEFDRATQATQTQQDWQKHEQERQKRLDVGTYTEKYQDKPEQALNEWADVREQELVRGVQSMVAPVHQQTQFTVWRMMKILNEVAPEVVEKHLQKEEKIKQVLKDVPALMNFPDYLDQAEKMALAGMKGKDLKDMQKDIEKKVKKSMEQKSGVSIPTTKAPTKGTKTKEERYKDYIVGKGRRSTIL